MFNLTHDDSSAVDIGGVWTGADEFELHFRFNADFQEDLEIHLVLNRDELQALVKYLDSKLALNFMRNM
jgi:hypothetical protein